MYTDKAHFDGQNSRLKPTQGNLTSNMKSNSIPLISCEKDAASEVMILIL
jgi:hypothetical protein